MLEAEPAPLATRKIRVAAACINVAPALVPLVPWLANALAGGERGYAALGFWSWSLATLLLVVLINTVLLLWRRQSLGLAYFGLAYEGASASRMLLGKVLVWGLPWLTLPLVVLPLVSLANWLVWLGPGRRTLADVVGGCRVVERRDFRAPHLLLELLMVVPIVALWPAYGPLRGGVVGGAAALLVVFGVIAWRRAA